MDETTKFDMEEPSITDNQTSSQILSPSPSKRVSTAV
jgi:hypothetical protein